MYIVSYTIEYSGGQRDEYVVVDTIEEAKDVYYKTIEEFNVYCAAYSEIIESTDWD